MNLRFLLLSILLAAAGCTSTTTSDTSIPKTGSELVNNNKISATEEAWIAESTVNYLYAPPVSSIPDVRSPAAKKKKDKSTVTPAPSITVDEKPEEFEIDDFYIPAKVKEAQVARRLKNGSYLLNRRNRMRVVPKDSSIKTKFKTSSFVNPHKKRNLEASTSNTSVKSGRGPAGHSLSGATFYSASLQFDSYEYQNNLNYLFYRYYAPSSTDYIQVSFNYLGMEYYDYVKIYDEYGLCASYNGSMSGSFVSNTCSGNYLDIWVITDSAVSGADGYDGFLIDGFWATPNTAPYAYGTASQYSAPVNKNIYFNSDYSYDAETSIDEFYWTFGDGSTSYSANPSHTFSQHGDYYVTLRVRDTHGSYAYDGFWVSVYQNPPALSLKVQNPQTSVTNPVRLSLYDSSGSGSEIQSAVIDWGDSSQTTLSNFKSGVYQHSYSSPGLKTIVVTAYNTGGSDTQSAIVTVTGEEIPPFLSLKNENFIMSRQNARGYKVSPSYKVADDGTVTEFKVNFGSGTPNGVYSLATGPFYEKNLTINYVYKAMVGSKYKKVAGVYNIVAEAKDNTELTNLKAFTFATKNNAPKLSGGTKKNCNGSGCEFHAGGSKDDSAALIDTDGVVTDKYWQFLGADKLTEITGCPRMDGRTASCTFPGPGIYFAKFTLHDNLGKSKSYFKKVKIK